MKQSKRITACILVVVLLISGLSVGAFASDPTATVKVILPSTLPAKGKTFTVSVEISGNPGLCAAQYTLGFDITVVDCKSVKIGSALAGMMSASNPDAETGAKVACASADPVSSNGTMSEYTFEVLKAGEPKFTLSDCVFAGNDRQPVTVKTTYESTGTASTPTTTESGVQSTGTGTQSTSTASTQETQTVTNTSVTQSFTDVPSSYWGYSYIEKAVASKLVSGNPDGTFAPEKEMTRAEFVTMLFRLSGDAAVTTDAGFTDIPATSWYRDAVNWAAVKGYVKGSNGKFLPNGKITRQEVVTILYRYCGGVSGMEAILAANGMDSLASFKDAGEISSWAKDAMRWAVYNSIVSGTSADTVSPNGTAKRAQVAAIFVRYAEKQAS